MRLLQCDLSGHITRTADIRDKELPKYAILSHTWASENDEVSFDDIDNGTFMEKPGYHKIRFCAEQAAKDGLHYFWIDTCCINKKHETELSRSLRSMWRRYSRADICYALLSDVSAKPDEDFSDWARFSASRWFTRGWTLQELLAPSTVKFFSSEGHSIGTKRSLERKISHITGIPLGALRNEPLAQYTVSDRFRWQEGRQTCEAEDIVYSMFGIFNTYMQVLYGEGADSAVSRLRRKLVAKPDKHEQAIMDFLPFPKDTCFVTRPEMDLIKHKLISPGMWMALVGLGGVGKSQLAIKYAYRVQARYTKTVVLWIYCSSAARFDQSMQQLARDLKLCDSNDDTVDAFHLLYSWLKDSRRHWFIVLDNADDSSFLFKPPERDQNLEPHGQRPSTTPQPRIQYIPHCEHGRVLITSRSRASALRLVHNDDIIDLHVNKTHNEELLKKRLGTNVNAATVEQLVQKLDSFPLAIVQATAYIAERGPLFTPEDYLALLEQTSAKEFELLGKHEDGLGFRRDLKEADNSIMMTWQLSFEHILDTQPSAANLLSLMSFYNYQGIPISLLKAREDLEQYDEVTRSISFRQRLRKALRAMKPRGYTWLGHPDETIVSDEGQAELVYCTENFDADVQMLRDYNLVSVNNDGSILSMHRLVQLAAQHWLQTKEQYTWLQAQSLQKLAAAFPRHSAYDRWEKCRLLYPHAILAQSFKVTEPEVQVAQAAVLHIAA